MYRSRFTRRGRIVAGEDLVATTLCGAITEASEMLHQKPTSDEVSGFEIWTLAKLLHTSS